MGSSCFHLPSTSPPLPTTTTSIYSTPLGPAAVTWSRTILGPALHLHLLHHPSLRFHLRLWLPRGRRLLRRAFLFSWDLSHASFSPSHQPTSGFHLSVSLHSKPFLSLGDPSPQNPLQSTQHLVFPGGSSPKTHRTRLNVAGRDREVVVELPDANSKDAHMGVFVDGKEVLRVKRLRWKFRGSERVEEAEGGGGGAAEGESCGRGWEKGNEKKRTKI